MGDMSEIWDEERKEYVQRRDKRVEDATQIFNQLKKDGYKVEFKTEYHIRINDTLDLFPVNKKFHNVKTNKRGKYSNIISIIQQTF